MRISILLLALAGAARAQTPTYTNAPSTSTYSGVSVSTYQATQIDNWVRGVSGQTLPNRTAILVSLPSGKMNCAYDVNVSTQATLNAVAGTVNPQLGLEFDSGIQYTFPLTALQGLWCMMQAQAAAQGISVHQVSPFRPGTRTIPGSP